MTNILTAATAMPGLNLVPNAWSVDGTRLPAGVRGYAHAVANAPAFSTVTKSTKPAPPPRGATR